MHKRPSIYAVNILFLIVLCLQAVNFLFLEMPQFVRMILNEALFVLLPTLIFLRLMRLPFRETVRWRWPGWSVAVASLLVGAGLYPLAMISMDIYQTLLGYRIFGGEQPLPRTAFEGVLGIIAYAVMPPLCEEIFARGVIQRAYERLGRWRAILFAGGLFIVFHLSLLQGLVIIPLVLVLGYVYWRSESLVASILTHFGANVLAAFVVTRSVFWKNAFNVLLSMPALVVGIILTAAALWWLTRATSPAVPERQSTERPRLWRAWPLLLSGLLYAGVIGVEFVGGRSPERFLPPVEVDAAPWDAPVEWRYEIRNIVDDPVGQAQCSLTPETDEIELLCHSQHRAYDVGTGHGRYVGSDGEIVARGRWRRANGTPLQAETVHAFQWQSRTAWVFDGVQFAVTQQDNDQPEKSFTLALESDSAKPSFVLAERLWPWTLLALPFADDYAAAAHLFTAYTWRQATSDSGPQMELVLVTVSSPETVTTQAGTFRAWKVQAGESKTAWYTIDAPHTLVKYFDGAETWLLEDF